jgi:predicted kinase
MKLKMLSGLPASGKTTLARKLVKESGSAGRVNRDDLRRMLFDSVWSGNREEIVVACEKAIAKVLLEKQHVPVIDDTNLTPRHREMWSGFAREQGATFETQELAASWEECVRRDKERGENSVGPAVITKMAALAGKLAWKDEVILCDIDGTIANGEHRERHLRGEKKDWDTYYSLLGNDLPIDLVIRWIAEEHKDRTVVLVSGRPDTYQRETISWLWRHDVQYDYLLMRASGDRRPDTQVKADLLKLLPREKIVCVIDDRPSVIRMWKEQGLRVIPVRGACEEF